MPRCSICAGSRMTTVGWRLVAALLVTLSAVVLGASWASSAQAAGNSTAQAKRIVISNKAFRQAIFVTTQVDLRTDLELFAGAAKTRIIEELIKAAVPAKGRSRYAGRGLRVSTRGSARDWDRRVARATKWVMNRTDKLLGADFTSNCRSVTEWTYKYRTQIQVVASEVSVPGVKFIRMGYQSGFLDEWLDRPDDPLAIQADQDLYSSSAAALDTYSDAFDRAQKDAVFRDCWDNCVGEETGITTGASVATMVKKDDALAGQSELLELQGQSIDPGKLEQLGQSLYGDIDSAAAEAAANLSETFDTQGDPIDYAKPALDAVKAAIQEKADERDKKLQGKLDKAKSAVSTVGNLVGKYIGKKEGKYFTTVGNAAIMIAKTISKWSADTATLKAADAIFSMAGAAATGNIISAVSSIVGMFGPTQPTGDQMIMEQIQKLQQQIADLQVHVDKRFDRVDKKLTELFDTMVDRFDRVDAQFGQVEDYVHQTQIELLQLRSDLDRFQGNMFNMLGDLSKESLSSDIDQAVGYQKHYGHAMPKALFEKLESNLYVWATQNAFDTTHTASAGGPYDDAEALQRLRQATLETNLNYLDMLTRSRWQTPLIAEASLPVIDGLSHLPNPRYWVLASRAYARMMSEWPAWARSIDARRAARIASIGKALQHGLSRLAVQKTPDGSMLLDRLFEDYPAKIDALAGQLKTEESKGIHRIDAALYRLDRLGGVDQFPFMDGMVNGWNASQRVASEFTDEIQCVGVVDAAKSMVPWPKEQVDGAGPEYKLFVILSGGEGADCRWDVTDMSADPWGSGTYLTVTVYYRINEMVVEKRERHQYVSGVWLGTYESARWYAHDHWESVKPTTTENAPGSRIDYGVAQARALLEVERGKVFSSVADSLHDAAGVPSDLALRNAILDVQGSKALLAAFLQLGLPNALQQDDLLRAMLYGKNQVPGETLISDLEARYQAASSGITSPVDAFTQSATVRLDDLKARVGSYQQQIAAGERDESTPLLATSVARANLAVRGTSSSSSSRPVLSKVTPTAARVGAVVTVTGRNFGARRGTSFVKFGTCKATTYVKWGAGTIKVKVPSATSKGSVKVTVTTAAGTSGARNFRRQ